MKLKNGKIYQAYQFTAAAHPDFLEFHNLFHKNNKKRITREILGKLTSFSIAVYNAAFKLGVTKPCDGRKYYKYNL